MSDSWDEKHERNKGKARAGFETSAPARPERPAQRAVEPRSVMDVLRGVDASSEKDAGPPEKERPAPPPPAMALGGTKPMRAPERGRSKDVERERMRALLQRDKEREREKGRER